jgi:predicted aldo/keto reductase-like oxidoreductase
MNIDRRNFFKGTLSAVAGLSLSRTSARDIASGMTAQSTASSNEEKLKIKRYRPLGSTGINVSDVLCGPGGAFFGNIVKYSSELGINIFDTAESYMKGRSEELLGEALKGRRDKATIVTKLLISRPADADRKSIIDRAEKSLQRLKTDYIDVYFIHAFNNPSLLKNEEVLSAFDALKKSGKIRFKGYSFHSSMSDTLQTTLDNDFAEVILFTYNHMEGPAIDGLIEKVRRKGIGIIAMKTLAGSMQNNLKGFINEKTSYPQACFKWIMSNPNIDCAAVSLNSFAHVEEYVAASGETINRKDMAMLKRYGQLAGDKYCRVGCNTCEMACPYGVAISDVMRFEMYYKDYGMEKMAMENYRVLESSKRPDPCSSCSGKCISACPFGLNIRARLMNTCNMLTT